MCTKVIKIICVMSDYCIGKRQYSYHGVDHISLHCKEYHETTCNIKLISFKNTYMQY